MSKYILLNIKIPIEILENENIPHMNNIAIDFTTCDVLPPEQNIDNLDIESIIQNCVNIMSDSNNINEPNNSDDNVAISKTIFLPHNIDNVIYDWNNTFIQKNSIYKKKQSKNITFHKKNKLKSHNFSVKNTYEY